MATTIYLARHCSYQNPQEIMTFRLPGYALNNQGRERAQEIAEFFKKNSQTTKIYSSPLLRTRQTAQIIAQSLNLRLLINSLLIEVESPFKGMREKDYYQNHLGDIYCQKEHLLGGGEPIEQISQRMMKFVQKVLKENPNEEIITISHGDPIMIYFLSLTGQSLENIDQRKDYIPMGGIIKLIFDENNKLESFKRINLN